MKYFCIAISLFLVLITACAPAPGGDQDQAASGLTDDSPQLKEDSTSWPVEDGYIVLQWPDLAIPDYQVEYRDEINQEVNIPLFREDVKQLNGKPVKITGFFFPFEDNPDDPYYVLSQYPFSQCFFCGAAGPESVMDLLMKEKPGKIKMDDYVTFKGRLKLNDNDVMFLNYILEDAELVP